MSGGSRVTALLKFLDSSPSPFHAVDECRKLLEAAGFLRLHEASSAWGLQTNGKYFFTRNGSSIVAFTIGGQSPINPTQLGVKIIAAHTDSPCLRMKPLSKRKAKDGFLQVAVETYGGGLWHTWFDRDLSVAGRIVTNSNSAENGGIKERLVNIVKPVMRIPTLAIHLDRSISTEGFKFNTELQLLPILATEHKEHDPNDGTSSCPMMHGCLYRAICESVKVAEHEEITGIDLCLYDVQNATLGGVHGEFVQSARLDNLFMSFAGLSSLLESSKDLEKSPNINMLVLFDNEEVGSLSAAGAESTLIHATIQRIFRSLRGAEFDLSTILARSFLISADMAHATHPNYP